MTKVWTVEYSDYSGGHVYGIFSTEENAEKYLADMREKEVIRFTEAQKYRLRPLSEKDLEKAIEEIRNPKDSHDFVNDYDLDPDYDG